jgi:hypothetical protein
MTTPSQPNPMFAHTKHGEAGSMRGFTTEGTPLSDPIVSAARWNLRRRRPYFRLRNFARAVASGMIDVRSGLLKALNDSRSRLAARVIDEPRHLIQDDQCIGVLHCADDTGLQARQTEPTEQ